MSDKREMTKELFEMLCQAGCAGSVFARDILDRWACGIRQELYPETETAGTLAVNMSVTQWQSAMADWPIGKLRAYICYFGSSPNGIRAAKSLLHAAGESAQPNSTMR